MITDNETTEKIIAHYQEEYEANRRQLRDIEHQIVLLDEKRLALQIEASRLKFAINHHENMASITEAFVERKTERMQEQQVSVPEATPDDLKLLRQQDELIATEQKEETSRRRAACEHQWVVVKWEDSDTRMNRCPQCGRWGNILESSWATSREK